MNRPERLEWRVSIEGIELSNEQKERVNSAIQRAVALELASSDILAIGTAFAADRLRPPTGGLRLRVAPANELFP
jgi:hypothetical protein